ncbi:MAG: 23S rRNA (pseudouridine(1915)-N(3))-methyltransferase RlmH [Chitinophagales bacterium]|nr:23S rRNA (pseudouridine(1915)-N(3))-methyltransferase RlmH [Chitinophagales bacterium]MDW8428237.1 23S rRNA (pseudouridine(1915)-N(3))-methyltransferase RlmH [Chitinophagales bacterium]
MLISIVLLSTTKDPQATELYNRYVLRLRKYCNIESRVLAEKKSGKQAWLNRSDVVVALDVRGVSMSSDQLAQWLQQRINEGRNLVFVIGGPDGIDDRLLQQAHWKLSLSPMTLPHHLARVVLAEQLYRAFTIMHGHPYHLEH